MRTDQITTLLDAVPMALILVGRDERVIAASSTAEALFDRADMAGRHYITVLRQPVVLDCVEKALKFNESNGAQFPTRNATGDVTLQVNAAPIETDLVSGVLLSLEDISHVQEATQMRRDFVANVSHELRTPLTALLGFIETLQGPAKDDPVAQQRFLSIMEMEASRMSRLIRDLLSLSRVESEERMRPTTLVDVAGLVTSASMSLGQLARENDVSLDIVGVEEGMSIQGDSDQLLQVVTNLMENGIKYGGNSLRVALTRQARDPALLGAAVRIDFIDDGDGIEEIHLPRLTQRFYRVDGHRSREMGGTGLGLAIVKHIVNRHRGRLRVKSTVGEGSTFSVILPDQVDHSR